jgi:predicted phosphodiesterase
MEGATQVILNGDTTELATPEFAHRAQQQLEELRGVVSDAGATLQVLAGNHDPSVSPQLHSHLNGDRILVTHGHAFHPMIVPWSPHAAHVAREHRKAWEEGAGLPPLERALRAAARAAVLERTIDVAKAPMIELLATASRPLRAFQIIAYWRIFPELAVRFRDDFAPQSSVVVCGHSHRAGAWWLRGCLVLNTGCFTFPGSPHAVLIHDDRVDLVPLKRTKQGWRYRVEVRRSWPMGEIAAAAASEQIPVS